MKEDEQARFVKAIMDDMLENISGKTPDVLRELYLRSSVTA